MISNRYFMLVGSLPVLPRDFRKAKRLPINEVRLRQRLNMLEPEDRRLLNQISDFLVWDRQPPGQTDADIITRYDQLHESLGNSVAWHLMEHRFAIRSLVAALRRRRLRLGPPAPDQGPFARRIHEHWDQRDFRLGHEYPWIEEIDELLNGPNPLQVERRLLEITWTLWSRMAEQYFFSFEAVLLYLARWEIVFRWTRQDRDAGLAKFEELVRESLGEYGNLYANR